MHTEKQAPQLINNICAILETSAAKLMLKENNIIINSPLCSNLPTKSTFLYGFQESTFGLCSHVIKIPKAKQVDYKLNIWDQIKGLSNFFLFMLFLQFTAFLHLKATFYSRSSI